MINMDKIDAKLETPSAGSGNLTNALDDLTSTGGYDDFLTGGDLTLDQIHNLSSMLYVLFDHTLPAFLTLYLVLIQILMQRLQRHKKHKTPHPHLHSHHPMVSHRI